MIANSKIYNSSVPYAVAVVNQVEQFIPRIEKAVYAGPDLSGWGFDVFARSYPAPFLAAFMSNAIRRFDDISQSWQLLSSWTTSTAGHSLNLPPKLKTEATIQVFSYSLNRASLFPR